MLLGKAGESSPSISDIIIVCAGAKLESLQVSLSSASLKSAPRRLKAYLQLAVSSFEELNLR